MKHTKGNWKQRKLFENPILVNSPDQDEFYSNTIDIVNEKGRIIASVDYQTNVKNQGWGKNDSIELWEANAKLIAAAPELLDLAKKVEKHFQHISNTEDRLLLPWEVDMWETAEQVIKKAAQ